MRSLALSFIVFSFFTVFASAKSSFQPGYIINQQGDTLKGLIDYRNWEFNPKTISFQASANSEINEYAPEEIRGFGVADDEYTSAKVLVPLDSDQESVTPNLMDSWVFLQVRVRGLKSLYYHKGKAESFYIKDDSGYHYLEYKKYVRKIGDDTKTAENKKFIGQLTLYLQDCSTLQSSLSKTKYNKKDLDILFAEYYTCKQASPSLNKKTETIAFKFGAVLGVSLTTFTFKSDNSEFDYLTEPSFPSSTNIAAGVFADAVFPKNNGRWTIKNELLFTTYSTEADYHYTTTTNEDIDVKTKIGNTLLRLNTIIRFNIPINKVALFIDAGIGNSVSLNITNEKITTTTYLGNSTTENEEALQKYKLYEFSRIIGCGIRVLERYTFEFRRQVNFGGLSPAVYLNSSANCHYFLLGYRF